MPRQHTMYPTLEPRFRAKVARSDDRDSCWPWTGTRPSNGYGSIGAGGKGGKMLSAHRVAYELAYGPIPTGMWVLHRCDNPACCNPNHLFLGTAKDNTRDAMRKGRHSSTRKHRPLNEIRTVPHGEDNPQARLTEREVRAIRSLASEARASGDLLAAAFGVSATTIRLIVQRRAWKHVS